MTAPTLPEITVMTQIARLLATETYTLEQIFRRYEFDQEYFDTVVAPNPYFRRVFEDYTKEWNSLGSSQKRLAFSALTALEEGLPTLSARMGDQRSDLSDAVAVGKLLRELAGIAAPTSQPAAGSGTPFSINISFGDSTVALKAESPPQVQHLIEGEVEGTTILLESERTKQDQTVGTDADRTVKSPKTPT